MREISLGDLVCPALHTGTRCKGALALSKEPLPAVYTRGGSPEEVTEGVVLCQNCGAEYPIIAGVLILIGHVKTYLAQHYSEIMSIVASNVSAPMVSYLQKVGYDLHDTGFTSSIWGNAKGMSLYISAHFDNLASILGPSHPLSEIVQKYSQRDLYAQMMDLAKPVLGENKTVLDIGCNVGGMSWRFSELCKFVYGVDFSFRAALTARQILLGQPEPIATYRYYQEGLAYQNRPLSIERRQNLEILVASGMELPFTDQFFQFVNCANVVDIVSQPVDLLAESVRVLNDGGHLLQTDPYFWDVIRTPVEDWIGPSSDGATAKALREQLKKTCDIIGEEDNLVWLLRAYDRCFHIYLNHCILAKKR